MNPFPRVAPRTLVVTVSLAALLAAGCTPRGGPESFPTIRDRRVDARSDGRSPDGNAPDGHIDRVKLDLARHLTPVDPASSAVRVFRASNSKELPGVGPAARARPGDVVLENALVSAAVEADDRAIGPCPYGGNLVDAVRRRDEGRPDDVVGEVCPLLNIGQTFDPQRLEILRDGSRTGVGVLAVTGKTVTHDYLNLRTMAPEGTGALLKQLAFDPQASLPLTVTVYYVLEPGARRIRTYTALRNDGDGPVHALFGHVYEAGGAGSYFNPQNGRGGFGYESLGGDNLGGTPLPYLAFTGGEGSHAYVPEPVPRLAADRATGGVYITLSGLSLTFLGRKNLLETLVMSEDRFRQAPGLLHLDPGGRAVRRVDHYVGTGELATVLDPIYAARAEELGRLEGAVVDETGAAVPGARVTAVADGPRTVNQTVSGADGSFSMRVPPGRYEVSARAEGRSEQQVREVTVEPGSRSRVEPTVGRPARLSVEVRTPTDQPVPARVTVRCVDSCPDPATPRERNVTRDPLPAKTAAIARAGPDGEVTLELPPGAYRITVSRGIEWSVWPADASDSGGARVELSAGESRSVTAEIAEVVAPNGVLSADFHVHAVDSFDSVVARRQRLLDMMGAGIDVFVSSDHDVVTDYRPTIRAMNAGDEIANLPGDEITTSDFGHVNGFPIPVRSGSRNGGALDWAGGAGPNLVPGELFGWIREHPGEQVVQVNHPANPTLGLVRLADVDLLRGEATASPDDFRIPADAGREALWSEQFSAIEVLNGKGEEKFWAVTRWWFTMIGRGFVPTGTGTTDTHRVYSHLGGVPRSFVFVPDDADSPAKLDREAFVDAVNAGRVVGSSGPVVRATAIDGGRRASGGETLRVKDGSARLKVTVSAPAWMDLSEVAVFHNPDGVVTAPGEVVTEPLAPTATEPLDWGPGETEVVASGDRLHRRVRETVELTLDVPSDGYAVVVARSSGGGPGVVLGGASPRAFTNPILLDADGGGYDSPPLADRASSTPADLRSAPRKHRHPHRQGHRHLRGESPDGASKRDLERRLREVFERLQPHL
ncbi:MAG: CehA/McbA family metallohydrolase [Bradymonadaceae bacterium]